MPSSSTDQQRKRLRRPVRQRQRLGLGQRQRAVRALDPAHGRAGRAAQHLPVQHPGPADLVRGAGHRGRPSRRARRHRSHGRDEPADLGQGRRLDRARRLPVLRLHQADAGLEIPRRHHRHRRAADRDLQPRIHRSAPAPAVQEHHLCRRALGAARHGRRGDREADRRAVQGQGEADRRQQARAASRPRLGARSTSNARSGCGCGAPTRSATASSSRATPPPRSAPSMAARPSAPGIRSRRPPRSPTPSPATASGCGSIPTTKKNNVRHRAGRGRTRLDRHGDRRRLERRARLHRDLRARHLADAGVPRARLFRRNPGGDLRRAARRPLDRHADAHPAVRHHLLRLCLARRHQARAAVPRRPGRGLRVRRPGLRSRRPAADADLRHARSRHRHEPPALPPAAPGTTAANTTAAR